MSATRKPAICFVTNELYPLGPGGIGRMLYNFAQQNHAMGVPAELHYLLSLEMMQHVGRIDELRGAFQGIATIHVATPLRDRADQTAVLMGRALTHHWMLERMLAVSHDYYRGLLDAEREIDRPFDVTEFPDYGGWALASIEAKRRAHLSRYRARGAAPFHPRDAVARRTVRRPADPARQFRDWPCRTRRGARRDRFHLFLAPAAGEAPRSFHPLPTPSIAACSGWSAAAGTRPISPGCWRWCPTGSPTAWSLSRMPATGNAAGWTPEARAGIETDRLDWLDLPAPAAPVADPSTAGAKPRGRLSAGLYDPIGMAAGLSLRLLALEPVMLPGETQGQPFVLEKRALAAMRRIAPAGMVREFEPVQYLEPHSALKVHPLHGGDTVAVIDIPNHRMERLEAEVRNLCPENSGIEVAIGCAPRAATPEEIAAALSRPDALPRRYTLGAWTLVAPHANVRLAVQVTGASRGQDRMLVLTRLPAGAGEGFAHLVVDKIAAWPAQAIF